MFDKFKNLVIGNLEDKREYKQMMKRVDLLPKDYKFAFKQIQKYIYTVGGCSGDIKMFTNINIFIDLLDLFEISSIDGRSITEVIGNDISKFTDEFISAYTTNSETIREKLNKEIMEKLSKEKK